jgi:hypothetical protein
MATDADMIGFPEVDSGKEFNEVVDSVFSYLFPKTWNRCGRLHSYQSLSEFVEDFPRLREAEIEAADDDILLIARLSDNTELTQLHSQEAFRIAVQTVSTRGTPAFFVVYVMGLAAFRWLVQIVMECDDSMCVTNRE